MASRGSGYQWRRRVKIQMTNCVCIVSQELKVLRRQFSSSLEIILTPKSILLIFSHWRQKLKGKGLICDHEDSGVYVATILYRWKLDRRQASLMAYLCLLGMRKHHFIIFQEWTLPRQIWEYWYKYNILRSFGLYLWLIYMDVINLTSEKTG